MKKLKKISINPEKVIKNDELVNLRGGGYGAWQVVCENGDYWGCGYDYFMCLQEGADCCDGPFDVIPI